MDDNNNIHKKIFDIEIKMKPWVISLEILILYLDANYGKRYYAFLTNRVTVIQDTNTTHLDCYPNTLMVDRATDTHP